MKTKSATTSILTIVCTVQALSAATSVQLYIDKLNTSSGIGHPAAGAAWAIIYDQNNDSALPGDLTDGSSLTVGNADAVKSHFSGVTIDATADQPLRLNGDKIIATGTVPASGVIDTMVTFDIGNGTNQVATGRSFAIYWFPELADGGTLDTSGMFSIGGFFEIQRHVASGSDYGMIIPDDGQSAGFLSFDSTSSWSESRLVAVTIPETSTLTLSTIGLGALLRRRRK